MKRTALIAALFLAAGTGSAFAGACSPEQESMAAMTMAKPVKALATSVVAVDGKQMLNVKGCDSRGGKAIVEFRYNFMAAGGYYWLEGKATVDPSGAVEVEAKKLSDNLAALDTGNTLLASR